MKNIKVGNVNYFGQIPDGVTLQIMGQISKLSFVQYPSAKLNKRKLQKAKIRGFLFFSSFWSFLQNALEVSVPDPVFEKGGVRT